MSDYRPSVGDHVSATLHGKLISYDSDKGWWILRTDGSDHISWDVELHWAQPFEPGAPR